MLQSGFGIGCIRRCVVPSLLHLHVVSGVACLAAFTDKSLSVLAAGREGGLSESLFARFRQRPGIPLSLCALSTRAAGWEPTLQCLQLHLQQQSAFSTSLNT